MPSNYDSTSVQVGDTQYDIRRVPTGFGRQQQRNGRFTVREQGNPSNYRDFSYGDSYSGYTSSREAWNDVKSYLRQLNR